MSGMTMFRQLHSILGDNHTGRCCPEAPFDVGGEKIKRLDLKNCELFQKARPTVKRASSKRDGHL